MFPLFPQHRSLRRSLPVRKSVRISHGGDISQCHHWDVSFIVAVNLTISLRSSCCGSRGWSNSFLSWMRIHWGLMCAEKYILIRSPIPFYMALFPKSWGYPKSSSRHGWPWLSTETTMVTWGSPMLGTPYLLYFIIIYCNCSENVYICPLAPAYLAWGQFKKMGYIGISYHENMMRIYCNCDIMEFIGIEHLSSKCWWN